MPPSSIYVDSISLYTQCKTAERIYQYEKPEKEGKVKRILIRAVKKEDTYVQHQINAQVNEDLCLAICMPAVRVNFFIHHACCSLLQSASYLHAFCFSILLHHLLLPSCAAAHHACFSLLFLSTSTTPISPPSHH